jgi:hypothetical protein
MAIAKMVFRAKISSFLFQTELLSTMKMANRLQISLASEQHSSQHAVDMAASETSLSLHQSVAHQVSHFLANQAKNANSLFNSNQ